MIILKEPNKTLTLAAWAENNELLRCLNLREIHFDECQNNNNDNNLKSA